MITNRKNLGKWGKGSIPKEHNKLSQKPFGRG